MVDAQQKCWVVHAVSALPASVSAMTDFEIIGFRYPGGELSYRGSMLTIYGQNGAGKSLLLESIESSLTGKLVGRPGTKPGPMFGYASSAVVVRGYWDWAERMGPAGRTLGPLFGSLSEVDGHIRACDAPESVLSAWSNLYRELRSAEVAVLVPTRSADREWHAYASVHPEGPAVTTWDRELASHIQASANHESADVDYEWIDEIGWHVSNLDGRIGEGGTYHVQETLAPLSAQFAVVINETTADPDGAVDRWIDRAMTPYVGSDSDLTTEELVEELEATRLGWTRRANELLDLFLLDPPELRLVVGDPVNWISGARPHWETAAGLSIGVLSDAEKRWSRFAIALAAPFDFVASIIEGISFTYAGDDDGATFAIDEDSNLPAPFLLIDEPERGLHRAAEAHLAAGLLALAGTGRVRPILATHSPALLDAGQGQIVHIQKSGSGGIGLLSELTASEISELKDFGLQPSSMLHRDRGYLLVEGEHDKQILEGWFSIDLASLRVAILPMRGTRNLWTVFDSEFLIERTDALLMPLLDDMALEPLYDLWASVEARVLDGRASDATGMIKRGMAKIPGGAKDVYEPLLVGTITRGVSQRFFPLGMSRKDVLEYLPVGELVDGATTWEALREDYRRSPVSMADRSGKAYKEWLRKVKGADLSPENLRLIAETTAPHPELKAMIAKISERLER